MHHKLSTLVILATGLFLIMSASNALMDAKNPSAKKNATQEQPANNKTQAKAADNKAADQQANAETKNQPEGMAPQDKEQFEKLTAAESAGQWKEARVILDSILKHEDSKLRSKLVAHSSKLDEFIKDEELADEYQRQGRTDKAVLTLEKTLGKIEDKYLKHDALLLKAVMTRLNDYKTKAAEQLEKDLQEKFNRVVVLQNNGDFATAITQTKSLIGTQKLGKQTKEKYEQKLTELEKLKLEKVNPSLLIKIEDDLVKGLKEAAPPIIYVLALFLLYVLYRLIFRPYQRVFYEISLEDQSDPAKVQDDKHHVLSTEMDQALKQIVNEINEGGELSGLVELGSAELSSMTTTKNEKIKITEYLNTNPIKIGVLTFNPKSLFELLAYLTRTRGNKMITGNLFKDGDEYVLNIEKHPIKSPLVQKLLNVIFHPLQSLKKLFGKKLTQPSLQIFTGRDKKRENAVAQAAIQLTVSESTSTVTKDWRSLEALINAKKILDKLLDYSVSVEKDTLMEKEAQETAQNNIYKEQIRARNLLQRSLALDPSNWVARYRLANVLCKIGDFRSAYWQYSYILDMLVSNNVTDDPQGDESNLRTYVEKNRFFPLLVMFNKISSMAKMGAENLRANTQGRRKEGFQFITYSLGDIAYLISNIYVICVDKEVKDKLVVLMNMLISLKIYYGLVSGGEDDSKPVIRAIDHTSMQMDNLRKSIYKIEADIKSLDELINENESAQQQAEQQTLPATGDKGKINEKESDTQLLDQQKLNRNEKTSVNDLIFQFFANTISAISILYEYHQDYPAEKIIRRPVYLFVHAKDIETWIYKQRMFLENQNRNAYAYAHAMAHNAYGRMNHIMMRSLISVQRLDKTDNQDLIIKYFNESERFLRWAIGFHLPASFADPYINLASLYLKVLDYDRLQPYLPNEWKSLTKDYLKQAIRLSPNNQKAHYLLGRLYQSRVYEDVLANDKNNKQKYFDLAIQEYDKAGEDSYSYYRASEMFVEANNIKHALTKLKQCMEIYHRYEKPHVLYLQLITRDYEEQVESLLKDPVNVDALNNLKPGIEHEHSFCLKIRETCIKNDVEQSNDECGPIDFESINDSENKLQVLLDKINDIKPPPPSPSSQTANKASDTDAGKPNGTNTQAQYAGETVDEQADPDESG